MGRAQIDSLVLQMSADINRMEKALNQARAVTAKQTKAIEDRFAAMNTKIVRDSDRMSADLRRTIAAIGVTAAVTSLTRYADTWTNLRNQVRQYADVVGPVEVSTQRLLRIANDAGVEVESLGVTFAASARAARNLGASAQQVYAFNEAVAKGSAIANTGVAAVNGALTQLGQSIGSPKAQLGEFNSIIEGTPRLAQAFADGIKEANGDVSKLRSLIASGEISGGELFQGLLSQLPKLREEFSKTENAISRSYARLQNAAVQYVGTMDRQIGLTEKFGGLINFVADNLDLFAAAAVATAAVLGTQGLAGAFNTAGDSGKKLVKQIIDNARAASTVRTQSAIEAARELRTQQDILSIEEDRLAVAQFRVNQARLAQNISTFTSMEEAKALGALRAAQSAVASDQARGLIGQGRAWDNYRDAIDRWARTSADAKRQMDTLIAAEAEYNRILVRHNQALQNVESTTAQAMATQARATPISKGFASVFAGLNTFLASPVGTIALIAALTFGIEAFTRASETAADKIRRVEDALANMRDAQDAVQSGQDELKVVNERITALIKEQGEAARNTADAEISAINDRIAKNKELASLYRDQALAELADARAQQAREDQDKVRRAQSLAVDAPVGPEFKKLQDAIREANAINAAGGSVSSGLTGADWSKLVESATQEARLAARAGKQMTDAQRELLRIAGERGALQAKIDALQHVIDGGDGEGSGGGGGGGGATGDAVSKLKRYQTALEDFGETLSEIRASEESAGNKSRATIQAVLDLAKAGESVAAAFAQIPNVADLLTSDDAGTLRAQLTKIVEESADSLATGSVKIITEFNKKAGEIEIAIADATAAGLTDRVEQLRAELAKLMDDTFAEIFDIGDGSSPYNVEDLVGRVEDLPDFVDEFANVREGVRAGVRAGLKEGIETDDWGQALRNAVAESVTKGFDEALNAFADAITDILTGQNGMANAIFSAIGSAFGFKPRASGGGAGAGSKLRVNEGGSKNKEFLFLGSNPAQVLRASDINSMVAGKGSAGGLSINAPLIVQGSIDAVTWPRVEAAMRSQAQQIMSAVPTAVNGTLTYNRRQKKRF